MSKVKQRTNTVGGITRICMVKMWNLNTKRQKIEAERETLLKHKLEALLPPVSKYVKQEEYE